MKRFGLVILTFSAFTLASCDKEKSDTSIEGESDTTVSETVLDDVDQVEGTISDAMINTEELDDSTDVTEDTQETDGTEEKENKDSE